MEKIRSSARLACTVLLFLSCARLDAANRFQVESKTVAAMSVGNEIRVTADLDQDILGFSVALDFDTSKIQIVEMRAGADVAAIGPEFTDGDIDGATGELGYGVVFDVSGPKIDKVLTSGNARELLVLVVDVLAETNTTVALDLVDVPNIGRKEPSRRTVFTDSNGVSVDAVLDDGELTVSDFRPQIDSFESNRGGPGQPFVIMGQNFDQPGLTVQVCSTAAEVTLQADDRIEVIAPCCPVANAIAVQVCTDRGCDSDPAGFTYTQACAAPTITSIVLNNGGEGTVFFVVGHNFDNPELSVRVCDVEAESELLADGQTIQVTSPCCPTEGPVELAVCTTFGCATDPAGFNNTQACGLEKPFVRGDVNNSGDPVDLSDAVAIFLDLFLGIDAPAPCRDALDANDDGLVDMSDGIFILDYIFRGATQIRPPFPDAGLDPTPDDLPDCE